MRNLQWHQTGLMITSANRAGQGISWNKRDQQKGPITIFSGRGKKTTSAVALMDWSVWRHCSSSNDINKCEQVHLYCMDTVLNIQLE